MSESKTIKVSPDLIMGKKSGSKRQTIIPSKVHENLNQLKKKLLDKLQETRKTEDKINIGVQPQDIKEEKSNSILKEKNTSNDLFQQDMYSLGIIKDKYEQKHDFVFIRDPFISDQNGLAIILRAGEPQRRIENRLVKRCLEHLELEIVEMPDKAGMRADGGEFYFCKKDNVLFSGLKRNTNRGVEFVAERLNVNELVILEGEGFHLDTFFTPVLNKGGSICSVVACNALMTTESKNALYKFADNLCYLTDVKGYTKNEDNPEWVLKVVETVESKPIKKYSEQGSIKINCDSPVWKNKPRCN